MFQFTTTNVINTTLDSTGAKLFEVLDAKGLPGSDILSVKRVANFNKKNIEVIYKAAGKAAETAKVVMLMPNGSAETPMRLSLYIGLTEASQNSKYSNDFKCKGKPFVVEFPWITNELTTIDNLIKIINKYQVFVFGEKLLKVSRLKTNLLAIEAIDEYQRFKKVSVEQYVKPTEALPMGDYKVLKDLSSPAFVKAKATKEELASSGGTEGIFVGQEGFGTYEFITHNLRLPTSMRTRAFGVNQDETPIPGALYNQYVIHYCVDRGILGSNAVGDLVKSKTTHVFYVLSTIASEFEAALKKVAPASNSDVNKEGAYDVLVSAGDVSLNEGE